MTTSTTTNFNPLGSRIQFDGLDGVWTVTEAVPNQNHSLCTGERDEKFNVRYMSEDRLKFIDCTISVQEIEGNEVLWTVDRFEGYGSGPRVKDVRTRTRVGADKLEAGDHIVKIEDSRDWKTSEVIGKFYVVVDTRSIDELIETWGEMNNPLRSAVEEASHHMFSDWPEGEGIGSSDINCVVHNSLSSVEIFADGLTEEQWAFVRSHVQLWRHRHRQRRL